jgi:Ca2+-binding RTX toxin-like protein
LQAAPDGPHPPTRPVGRCPAISGTDRLKGEGRGQGGACNAFLPATGGGPYGSAKGDTLGGGSGDDFIAGFDASDRLESGADTVLLLETSAWDLSSDPLTGRPVRGRHAVTIRDFDPDRGEVVLLEACQVDTGFGASKRDVLDPAGIWSSAGPAGTRNSGATTRSRRFCWRW